MLIIQTHRLTSKHPDTLPHTGSGAIIRPVHLLIPVLYNSFTYLLMFVFVVFDLVFEY